MPYDTRHDPTKKTECNPLGKHRIDGLTLSKDNQIRKWDRLRLLQNILTPLAKNSTASSQADKKPIMKALTKCGKFIIPDHIHGNNIHNVRFEKTESGRLKVYGTIRCKSIDCPVCGDHAKSDRIAKISKAVLSIYLD